MADWFVSLFGFMALLGVMAGCASEGTMGSSSGIGLESATTKGINRIASGAVEDSLNACLARIPDEASAGQKMLAEGSCRRDQAARL